MEKNRKKAEKTDALKPYEAFDRRMKLLAALMLFTGFILIIYLFYTFFFTDDGIQQFFASLWAFIYILGIAVTSKGSAKRAKTLRSAACGNAPDVDRDTVFGRFYTEFETFTGQNQWLSDAKVAEEEVCCGYVDLVIERNDHEFLINVDKDGLYMIADEETNEPVEKGIPISEFTDHGQIFEAIKAFVKENS